MTNQRDWHILRELAKKWMELANLPVMKERKRLWTALKDLRAERSMILVETSLLLDYVNDNELQCEDPTLRAVEKGMVWTIRHTEEVGDDIVIEPHYQVGWETEVSDYGISEGEFHRTDDPLAFSITPPIQNVEEINNLKTRTMSVNRQKSITWRDTLAEIFGDILPVTLEGGLYLHGGLVPARGSFSSLSGGLYLHGGLTGSLCWMLGMERMLLWMYDEPKAIHRLLAYLRDDQIAMAKWVESEQLLSMNNNNIGAAGSPGYTTSLPAVDYAGVARLQDIWIWSESQETINVSPKQFAEFYLPYMAELCKDYGLVYYGCCEPVHEKWEYIQAVIPNIRAVSISHWCNQEIMGEALGRKYVYSRKPMPAYLSGPSPDWEMVEKDAKATMKAAKNCNLEFIFRDLYTINGDRPRIAKWVQMVRGMM